ncbi:MAG: hypothetical protein NZ480_01990, partial [Bdellovibrionaceae bacterium]|nr:hypothetical protein [Pseudobdellovibrionaceae bacterium]MDW8190927.1 hypothetical protein [Pseudobdellovibrionaceae bacterium]
MVQWIFRFFFVLFFAFFGVQAAPPTKTQYSKLKTHFAQREEHEWRDENGNRVFKQVFNDRGDLIQEYEFSPSTGQMIRSKIIDPEAGIVRIITPEYQAQVTLDQERKRRKVVTHIKEKEIVIWSRAPEPCSQCDVGCCEVKKQEFSILNWLRERVSSQNQAAQRSAQAPGYHQGTYGSVYIAPECVNLFGDHVSNLVYEVIREGEQCFSNLKGKQSQLHLFRWKSLFENEKRPPKIFCQSSKLFNAVLHWAEATVPGDPNHPEVRINPTIDQLKNKQVLKNTLFHEFMHNMGYGHLNEVEYASSCPICCDSSYNVGENARQLACAICQMDSSRYAQMDYLEKLVEFETLVRNFPFSYQPL